MSSIYDSVLRYYSKHKAKYNNDMVIIKREAKKKKYNNDMIMIKREAYKRIITNQMKL